MAYKSIALEIEGDILVPFSYSTPELRRDFLEFVKSKNCKFVGDMIDVNHEEGTRIKETRQTFD